jgi:hypothetical protein
MIKELSKKNQNSIKKNLNNTNNKINQTQIHPSNKRKKETLNINIPTYLFDKEKEKPIPLKSTPLHQSKDFNTTGNKTTTAKGSSNKKFDNLFYSSESIKNNNLKNNYQNQITHIENEGTLDTSNPTKQRERNTSNNYITTISNINNSTPNNKNTRENCEFENLTLPNKKNSRGSRDEISTISRLNTNHESKKIIKFTPNKTNKFTGSLNNSKNKIQTQSRNSKTKVNLNQSANFSRGNLHKNENSLTYSNTRTPSASKFNSSLSTKNNGKKNIIYNNISISKKIDNSNRNKSMSISNIIDGSEFQNNGK